MDALNLSAPCPALGKWQLVNDYSKPRGGRCGRIHQRSVSTCTFWGQEGDCDTWGSSGCGVLGVLVFCDLWPPNVSLHDADSICDLSHRTPGSTPAWETSTITVKSGTHNIVQRESGASACFVALWGGMQQPLGNVVTQASLPLSPDEREANFSRPPAAFPTEDRKRSRCTSCIP